MPTGHTYILGSPTGTLYIGVTSNLYTRILQHKNGTHEGFSKQHNCTRLLHHETYPDIRTAIAREKQLKGWRREKKLNLIRTTNPNFKDLAQTWGWKLLTANEPMHPDQRQQLNKLSTSAERAAEGGHCDRSARHQPASTVSS